MHLSKRFLRACWLFVGGCRCMLPPPLLPWFVFRGCPRPATLLCLFPPRLLIPLHLLALCCFCPCVQLHPPILICVSRKWSPCRLFALVLFPLSRGCASVGRPLIFVLVRLSLLLVFPSPVFLFVRAVIAACCQLPPVPLVSVSRVSLPCGPVSLVLSSLCHFVRARWPFAGGGCRLLLHCLQREGGVEDVGGISPYNVVH